MKLITAYIQPYKLMDVKAALQEVGVSNLSVTNAIGCGQQHGYTTVYRGARDEINLLRKLRLYIVVNEEFVEPTIQAIIKGARTGNIGDGKIFVSEIQRAIRIRTGEEGTSVA